MAKVLHIQMGNMEALDDPETAQLDCEVKIMETGQTVFSTTVNPQVTLKNTLGVYKLPAVLNSEAITDAQQYLADNFGHAVNSYSKVYVRGGFSSAI
jgi:hypothetical protein